MRPDMHPASMPVIDEPSGDGLCAVWQREKVHDVARRLHRFSSMAGRVDHAGRLHGHGDLPKQPGRRGRRDASTHQEASERTDTPASPHCRYPAIDDDAEIGLIGCDAGLSIQDDKYDTISHTVGAALWLPGALAWPTAADQPSPSPQLPGNPSGSGAKSALKVGPGGSPRSTAEIHATAGGKPTVEFTRCSGIGEV